MKNSLLIFFFFLTSCGYQLGRSQNIEKLNICVSYAQKDFSGYLTNALIKEISYSPNLHYDYFKPDYTLEVKIINQQTKQIGYKYDRNNENVRQKNLRATEGRELITVEFSLIERKTNQVKIGPFKIKEGSDFDYVDPDSLNDLSFIDPNNNRVTVLAFSLGQLESIESAKEAAVRPLYDNIAKKIVDAISAYW